MSVVLRWPAKKWEKAPLMCRLFGHVWTAGWWGSAPYLRMYGGRKDGIGRSHYQLDCRCFRCDKKSTVAYTHGVETNGL